MANGNYDNLLEIGVKNGHISYNTNSINKITNSISSFVHNKLINLEDGVVDEYGSGSLKKSKFKNIDSGILCDISLGSIKNSSLFANMGPTIPIRLTFIGQVNTELDLNVREYGINNIIVEMSVIVKVYEHATMPLTSKKKEIVVKQPISIEIIKGEIPNYYNGTIN